MTEIRINPQKVGITYALADYAKELNNGKAVKISAKQWQNVMAKIAEFNSKRTADNKIFTGGTNFFGNTGKNFVISGKSLNFSEAELEIILQEMGLGNIKGLSIEKTSPQLPEEKKEEKPITQNNETATDTIPNVHRAPLKKIYTETPTDTVKTRTFVTEPMERPTSTFTLRPLNSTLAYIANGLTPTEEPTQMEKVTEAETEALSSNPARTRGGVEPDALPASLSPQLSTPLSIQIPKFELTTSSLLGHTSSPSKSTMNINKRTNEYNIKELKKEGIKVSSYAGPSSTVEVFNKKGEIIATIGKDGTFTTSKKANISQEEFDKFVEKKGSTVKITKEFMTLDHTKMEIPKLAESANWGSAFGQIKVPDLEMPKPELPFDIAGTPIKVSNKQIRELAAKYSQQYNIDKELILAVINQESSFRNGLTSHRGAMGLMQLMPATAQEVGVTDPWDPAQNIRGGTKVLRNLIKYYDGDVMLALAGYNHGIGNVDKKLKGKPRNIDAIYDSLPKETQNYVKTVYSNYIASKQQA